MKHIVFNESEMDLMKQVIEMDEILFKLKMISL